MGTNGTDINVSATLFDLNQGAFMGDIFGGANDWNGSNEMWNFQVVNELGVMQTADDYHVGGMELL
jgi:hypothetical protein